MFVTSPGFEHKAPFGLLQAGKQLWRAVELSTGLPWFIVTVAGIDGNADFCSDVLLSWGEDLATLVAANPDGAVRAIQYVEPPFPRARGNWRLRHVLRVWREIDDGDGQPGELVFEDNDGEFREPLSGRTSTPIGRRVLLIDVTSGQAVRRSSATGNSKALEHAVSS